MNIGSHVVKDSFELNERRMNEGEVTSDRSSGGLIHHYPEMKELGITGLDDLNPFVNELYEIDEKQACSGEKTNSAEERS